MSINQKLVQFRNKPTTCKLLRKKYTFLFTKVVNYRFFYLLQITDFTNFLFTEHGKLEVVRF